MKNTDNMLTFFDAWMLAMEGKNPSDAIENQEKRGQAEVIRTQRLPNKLNSHAVPNDVFWFGTNQKMDYETKRQITEENVRAYTRVQYEKMGIEIVSLADDLFWNVKLPEGWAIKPTEHSMWNELRDEKNRIRLKFFYKAAFYDRDAFSSLQTRFQLDVTHIADPADYDAWKASDYQGTVKDGDTIICQTRCVPPTGNYEEDDKITDELWAELRTFMEEHWPEYKDVHAYWD